MIYSPKATHKVAFGVSYP